MPTSTSTPDPSAGPSDAEAAESRSERDPQQETVETPGGVRFLHAGSGNSLGDGLTAGGQANIASRAALPDTNDAHQRERDSISSDGGSEAQP